MLKVDEQIGDYTLVEYIDEGNFGEVWRAVKRTNISETEVALKFFRPRGDIGIDLGKIKRELETSKKLSGLPHIVSVYEADRFHQYIYIVSEYADGGSLEKWLRRNGGKAENQDEAVGIILEILKGLEYMHRQNIVHRDLKPANILIKKEIFCLADFGISREIKTHSKATHTAGTFEYMPPEAFDRTPTVTPHTDIWSAGVIFQKLLCGELPFSQDEGRESLMRIILDDPPRKMPAHIPEGLRKIVEKALQKKLENRYQKVAEMRKAIEDFQSRTIIDERLEIINQRQAEREKLLQSEIDALKHQLGEAEKKAAKEESKHETPQWRKELQKAVRRQVEQAEEKPEKKRDDEKKHPPVEAPPEPNKKLTEALERIEQSRKRFKEGESRKRSTQIAHVHFFGSPRGGFQVYPYSPALAKYFYGYIDNTVSEDWVFFATKNAFVTKYVYIRYGLLEAAVTGRSGSLFGVSIDFLNHYFTDLIKLRELMDSLWRTLLIEKVLVEKQENTDKIAFIHKNFADVSAYLEDKTKRILNVLTEDYSEFLTSSDKIPDRTDNKVYKLHPDSSAGLANRLFEAFGTVGFASKSQIKTAADLPDGVLPPKVFKVRVDPEKKTETEPTRRKSLRFPIKKSFSARITEQIRGLFIIFPGLSRTANYLILSGIIVLLMIGGFFVSILIRRYVPDSNANSDTNTISRPKPRDDSPQLNPPPAAELTKRSLVVTNQQLRKGMSVRQAADVIFKLNPAAVGLPYGNQRDAYISMLIKLNEKCLEDGGLTCDGLEHIPSLK